MDSESKQNSSLFTALATVLLVLCAVIITAVIVKREFFPRQSGGHLEFENEELSDETWTRLISSEDGGATSAVTIVEFFDYECPFCKQGLAALEHVAETFGDDLTIIRRHLPLTHIHPAAMPAALASECARSQDAFDTFHGALFAKQDSLSGDQEVYIAIADEVGISSIDAFRTCLTDAEPREVVEADVAMAQELGITGTPTLVINGKVYPGAQTPESLNAIVRSHLDD